MVGIPSPLEVRLSSLDPPLQQLQPRPSNELPAIIPSLTSDDSLEGLSDLVGTKKRDAKAKNLGFALEESKDEAFPDLGPRARKGRGRKSKPLANDASEGPNDNANYENNFDPALPLLINKRAEDASPVLSNPKLTQPAGARTYDDDLGETISDKQFAKEMQKLKERGLGA